MDLGQSLAFSSLLEELPVTEACSLPKPRVCALILLPGADPRPESLLKYSKSTELWLRAWSVSAMKWRTIWP